MPQWNYAVYTWYTCFRLQILNICQQIWILIIYVIRRHLGCYDTSNRFPTDTVAKDLTLCVLRHTLSHAKSVRVWFEWNHCFPHLTSYTWLHNQLKEHDNEVRRRTTLQCHFPCPQLPYNDRHCRSMSHSLPCCITWYHVGTWPIFPLWHVGGCVWMDQMDLTVLPGT